VKKIAYLSLGSNLGDTEANLRTAAEQLEQSGVHILRSSPLYETEPQGLKDQPWFLNQVVEVETSLFPRQLLTAVKRIEIAMGRKPAPRNSARVIDIDILLYGTSVVRAKDLQIPHPRMSERRFVLVPLGDLVPNFLHPLSGIRIQQLLAQVPEQGVRRKI